MTKRSAFRREEPVCGWCWAYLGQRYRNHYRYEPFVAYRRHSPELAKMHAGVAVLGPHPSTARWDPLDRMNVLRYLAWRDGERCGLCAMPLPAGLGDVEHVVPKKFGRFENRQGHAVPGSGYESRLHHVDNLQAAHDYCNRAKGNNPRISEWRHPEMWSLPVATKLSTPNTYLWVPGSPQVTTRPAQHAATYGYRRPQHTATHTRATPQSTQAPFEPQASVPPPPAPRPEPHNSITNRRSRKRMVLYTISGLIAFSGLTAGWQSGAAGVLWMLFVAGLFFIWARRSGH